MSDPAPVAPVIACGAVVCPKTTIGHGVSIGYFALIDPEQRGGTLIGHGVTIGHHALIEDNVVVGDNCVIDAYCRVCSGTRLGPGSMVLYGAAIFEGVLVGKDCIIGGNVADRTIIEDYVTYFGEIAHAYRVPGDIDAWDGALQPSPVIRSRSVVGQNALLIGGIEVGESAFVAAAEVVRCNVPAGHMFFHGQLRPLEKLRGHVQARTDRG